MFDMILRQKHPRSFVIAASLWLVTIGAASGQTTSFTYQGRLIDSGIPANGNYDLQFALWDSVSSGNQIGLTQTISNVTVNSGIFTVTLNFGANAFSGTDRFLEISARVSGGGSFTLLSPRQPITSTPYAVRSLNAGSADTATSAAQLNGVAAANFVQTNDARLSDARPPTAGSANYIQNTSSPQTSSNFNISGDGTAGGTLSANVVNATTQYNIGGNHVLSTTGLLNLFAGVDAGSKTTGSGNAFFGVSAGSSNTTGGENSFFGLNAGGKNMAGCCNTFFGAHAGQNTTGIFNSFFGDFAGNQNTTGNSNTVIGNNADVGSGNLDHATAIGADAVVSSSNTIVLGRTSEKVVVSGTMLVGRPSQSVAQLTVATIPLLPSAASVCFNAAGDLLQCGGSSLRWKTNVRPFGNGLEIIRRLRPISFNWKEGGQPDIGLGAEEVAKVAPSLTLKNRKGEAEGVKYDRLNIVLINAVKQQQQQIEAQENQIKQQQTQVEFLLAANAKVNARLRVVEQALNKRKHLARRTR